MRNFVLSLFLRHSSCKYFAHCSIILSTVTSPNITQRCTFHKSKPIELFLPHLVQVHWPSSGMLRILFAWSFDAIPSVAFSFSLLSDWTKDFFLFFENCTNPNFPFNFVRVFSRFSTLLTHLPSTTSSINLAILHQAQIHIASPCLTPRKNNLLLLFKISPRWYATSLNCDTMAAIKY